MPKTSRYLLHVCLLWAAASGMVSTAETQEIHWYKDLDEASSAASETNKPMMLDFWADWCVACRVMEKEVYTDAAVIEAATTRFLPVQVDFDRRPELARKYRIEGLPTLLFTDSRGEELFRYAGILDSVTLTELLKALPADVSETNRLRGILKRDKNNFEALVGLGAEMRTIGLWRMSNEYYGRALKQDPAKRDPVERERLLTAMGLSHLQLQESKDAARVFERCLKEFPASENKPAFLLGLGQAYALGGGKEQAKARKHLEMLLKEYPNSDHAAKAAGLLAGLE